MSMWRRPQQRELTLQDAGVSPRAPLRRNMVNVTPDTALRHSAVWACLRIRADLVSTFPIDVFRKVGRINVEVSKAPILVAPGGKHWPLTHWMWASQFELDRGGNTIGIITEKNSLGLPARIDLQPIGHCQVFQNKNMPEHKYRIDGQVYDADQIWHERQFPVPGLPVGLSPVAYAAYTLTEALSMQQFALDWFSGGGVPKARLHNTKKALDSNPNDGGNNEARRIKDRYMATVANGDVFVHGNDWELDFLQGESMGIEWLDGRRAAIPDLARYFGCPVDLIEAAINAPGSITYQSALQRNLQFLVMHLNPAVIRREEAISIGWLPQPRFVKFNSNALLRMDPEIQAKVIGQRIKDRTLTPDEARQDIYDLPPLTPAQVAEFDRLFGAPRTNPTTPAAHAAGEMDWRQVSPFSAVPYDIPSSLAEIR
jgi:HK97 family phage portal protein